MCKKTNYKTSNPRIDKCIRPLIKWLQDRKWNTVGCCCGHEKYPITVIVKLTNHYYIELFTNTIIPRTRNFYRRDEDGYYYIPEVSKC